MSKLTKHSGRTDSVEEVILPVDVVESVHGLLRASNAKLPPKVAKFGPWDVGLLDRFVDI
jgi:hypothetical protein